MKDILDRIADSSPNESSHELVCRLRDCAHEIEALRAALAARPDAQADERGAMTKAWGEISASMYARMSPWEFYQAGWHASRAAAPQEAQGVPEAAAQAVCRTCNGNGMIGGPSYYAPDEGGEPCPDCCDTPSYCSSVRRCTAKDAEQPKQSVPAPLSEYHEDTGAVVWWTWQDGLWLGEPAWIGMPDDSDWPGYHTHWTYHPEFPLPPLAEQPSERGKQECPHGVDDGACKQCYGEAVRGEQVVAFNTAKHAENCLYVLSDSPFEPCTCDIGSPNNPASAPTLGERKGGRLKSGSRDTDEVSPIGQRLAWRFVAMRGKPLVLLCNPKQPSRRGLWTTCCKCSSMSSPSTA